MDRFNGQIVDGRFLGGETIQFGGDSLGNVGVDGPGATGGSTDEGEERSWRWIRFARGKDAANLIEDEEGVEMEIIHCNPTSFMQRWMFAKRVQNFAQIHQTRSVQFHRLNRSTPCG